MPQDVLDDRSLRRLIDVGRALVAELDLETVLLRVLDAAKDLTSARYAALGVIDEDGRLERFLTLGIEREARERIGSLPSGRGVLGALIAEPRALRLARISDDPRAIGFPPEHPPMSTFLGVPVLIHGEAYGNLYLTEKAGGEEFSEADEQAVVILAQWAAVAIENARLVRRLERRRTALEHAVRTLRTTTEIARAIGDETDIDRVLELIAVRARALVDARSVSILIARDGDLEPAATAGATPLDLRDAIPIGASTAGSVFASRRALRLAEKDIDAASPELTGVGEVHAGLWVPLIFRGAAVGVLIALDHLGDNPGFSAEDEELLTAFGSSAATAIATAQNVARELYRRTLEAAEAERHHWARELHDDTLQAMAGLQLTLKAALRGDDAATRAGVEGAIDQIAVEIDKLRALVTELRPAALDELGLQPAVELLVERKAAVEGIEINAELDLDYPSGREPTRLAADISSTVYRVIQEALNNAARHAGAERVDVSVREAGGRVLASVVDDGRGFDLRRPSRGFGLVGMRERAALAGGSVRIESSPGRGTAVHIDLPARRADSGERRRAADAPED